MNVAFTILACLQPGTVGSAEMAMAQVLGDWASHQDALDDSVSEWSIVRHDRSATFGPNPRTGSRDNGPNRWEETVRVVCGRQAIRVESACPPSDAVVGPRSQFEADFLGQQTTKVRYDAALRSRFTLGMHDVPSRVQPYVFIRTADRETHFWDAVGDAPACAAVVAAGQAVEYFDVPVVALIVEALQCALPSHPEHSRSLPNTSQAGSESVAWEREHDEATAGGSAWLPREPLRRSDASQSGHWSQPAVVPGSPRVMGQTCVVIDEDREAAGTIRYWVDAEHNHRVLRCFVRDIDGELRQQFDYAYSPEDRESVPGRINIMLFRNSMVIHDVLTVERTQFQTDAVVSEAGVHIEFPPATLVTDFIAGRQYLTEDGGGETNLRSQQKKSSAADVGLTQSFVSRLWTRQGMAFCVALAGTTVILTRWLRKRKDTDKSRSHDDQADEVPTERTAEAEISAIVEASKHRGSGDG